MTRARDAARKRRERAEYSTTDDTVRARDAERKREDRYSLGDSVRYLDRIRKRAARADPSRQSSDIAVQARARDAQRKRLKREFNGRRLRKLDRRQERAARAARTAGHPAHRKDAARNRGRRAAAAAAIAAAVAAAATAGAAAGREQADKDPGTARGDSGGAGAPPRKRFRSALEALLDDDD